MTICLRTMDVYGIGAGKRIYKAEFEVKILKEVYMCFICLFTERFLCLTVTA